MQNKIKLCIRKPRGGQVKCGLWVTLYNDMNYFEAKAARSTGTKEIINWTVFERFLGFLVWRTVRSSSTKIGFCNLV